MEAYTVNSILIDKDTFMRKIIETLDVVKFANVEQLSFLLVAKPKDVKSVLLDIIVWYIKNNPGTTYKELCIDLSIKSEYVDELVKAGVIFQSVDVSKDRIDIKNVEKSTLEITNQFIKEEKRKRAIRGLSNANTSVSNNVIQKKKVDQFYTNPNRSDNRRW